MQLKMLISTALTLIVLGATAQIKVGNNPTTINSNSLLEMETTDKGLLLPRVALTSSTAFAPLSAHVAGMAVYNTATAADVVPGYYYNDGTKWVKVAADVNEDFWGLLGNAGTNPTTNFLGTKDNVSLKFRTNNIDRAIIDNLGKVGIGTSTPSSLLTVSGPAEFYVGGSRTGNLWNGTSSVPGVEAFASATDSYFAVQRPTASGALAYIMHLTRNGTHIANMGMVDFAWNGTFLGGITSPTNSTIAYNTTSDIRLKENIRPSTYGLTELMKIDVRDYTYKIDETKTVQNGFLAQQLYSVYPMAVTPGGDDAKTQPWMVDYGKITPLLVKSMQDQQAQILTQQAQILAQQAQIEELKAAIKNLQQKK